MRPLGVCITVRGRKRDFALKHGMADARKLLITLVSMVVDFRNWGEGRVVPPE